MEGGAGSGCNIIQSSGFKEEYRSCVRGLQRTEVDPTGSSGTVKPEARTRLWRLSGEPCTVTSSGSGRD